MLHKNVETKILLNKAFVYTLPTHITFKENCKQSPPHSCFSCLYEYPYIYNMMCVYA